MLSRLWRNKRGQALVEYAILIGAVSIVCLIGASLLGHKAGDLLGEAAALLPGDDADDQGAIFVSKLVKTEVNTDGYLQLTATPGDSTTFLPGVAGFASASTPTGGSGLIADEPDGN